MASVKKHTPLDGTPDILRNWVVTGADAATTGTVVLRAVVLMARLRCLTCAFLVNLAVVIGCW